MARGISYSGVVAALALVAGCGGGPAEGGAGAPGGGRGGGVPVDIVTLAEKPVEDTASFVGMLKSRRSSNIQPQAEGFITKILVKSGDRVSVGTPLFEIDASAQQAAVAGLESVRAAREADAAFARQQADRAKSLLAVGAVSQQEFEQAVTQQRTADAQLKAIQDQIRQQQAELAYYTVVSPAAGVIGDVPVRPGERVSKSTLLTTVDDNAGLEVYINIPVQQAPRLRLGLPVRLVNDAGATIATERVNFIAAAVDDATQTVLVKTPLTAGREFRADQSVRAVVVFETAPGVTVPVVAVLRVNGQFFVFVAEGGERGGLVARQRAVVLGDVVGSEYVVRSGLKAGEKLIAGGIQKIGDGAPVMTLPSAPGPAGPPAAGGSATPKPAGDGAVQAPAGESGRR